MTFIDNLPERDDSYCQAFGHNWEARYVGSKLYEKCSLCGRVKKHANLRKDLFNKNKKFIR